MKYPKINNTFYSLIYIPCALVCAKRKRCYDVMLSIQEGGSTRNLASALVLGPAGRWKQRTSFSDVWRAGRADRNSICPLDRMY